MKSVRVRRLLSFVILCFFMLSSVEAWGCTGFMVGKNASASGYAMYMRTEDSVSTSAKRQFVYPAGFFKQGEAYVDPSYGWIWTFTHDSYRMTIVPDMPINTTNVYGQAGVNEYGLNISTVVTSTSRSGTLIAGNQMTRGIAESTMQEVIVGECKDAEEALKLWGEIVEKDGCAENLLWYMNDAEGNMWLVDNCGGRRWVAARVPDDCFSPIANDMNIDYVDLEDTYNFRGSKDLLTFPVVNNFAVYGPPPNQDKIHISLTYGQASNGSGNSGRKWMAFNMFAPSYGIGATPRAGTYSAANVNTHMYPTFVKPDRLISATDIMKYSRSRYEGTYLDGSTANATYGTAALNRRQGRYIHMVADNETSTSFRFIGTITQKEAHIFEQIPGLPPEIGCRWWLIEGQPEYSVYLPFYGNVNDFHPAYKRLTVSHAFDPESAFWMFREISQLGRANRSMYGKPIQAYWYNYEEKLFDEQEGVLKELLARYESNTEDAAEWITDYTLKTSQAAMNRAGVIRKELVKHMGYTPNTNNVLNNTLFVVPDDSVPYVNATFDIHPTSGDALFVTSNARRTLENSHDVRIIAAVEDALKVPAGTLSPAWLMLPNPYPLQRYTPQLYMVDDLVTGHPASLGKGVTVLPTQGVRTYGALRNTAPGNLMKVQYTVEIQGPSYEMFKNNVAKVKNEFSLHTILPQYPNGLELVGPNGVAKLADLIEAGNAWVYGDKDRATVVVNFYLVDAEGLPVFGNGHLVLPDGAADSYLDTGALWAGAYIPPEIIDVNPYASVEKLNGNKNNLTITIIEDFDNGEINIIEKKFSIDNNAAGTYEVGGYKVYVDTKGNTQIRACYIVK